MYLNIQKSEFNEFITVGKILMSMFGESPCILWQWRICRVDFKNISTDVTSANSSRKQSYYRGVIWFGVFWCISVIRDEGPHPRQGDGRRWAGSAKPWRIRLQSPWNRRGDRKKPAQPAIHITRSPGTQKWMPPPGYLEKRTIDTMSLVVLSDRECAASWSTRILTFKHQRGKIRWAGEKKWKKNADNKRNSMMIMMRRRRFLLRVFFSFPLVRKSVGRVHGGFLERQTTTRPTFYSSNNIYSVAAAVMCTTHR